MYFGNIFISTQTVGEPDNKAELFPQILKEMPESPVLGVYFDFSEYEQEIQKINSILEEYDGLATGQFPDVDATVSELNARLYEAGLQKVLDAANQKLADVRGEAEQNE